MLSEMTLLFALSSGTGGLLGRTELVVWGGDQTRIPADIGPTRLLDTPTGFERLNADEAEIAALASGLTALTRAAAALPYDPEADRRMDEYLRARGMVGTSKKSSKRAGAPKRTIG